MTSISWTSPATHFGEISYIFRCNLKPNADLVYWACQVEARQADGTTHAGGFHFGMQTANYHTNSPKGACNFGGYDIINGPPGSTFRGSISALPAGPGGPPSPLFAWHADRNYLLKVKKSARQFGSNPWLAAELSTDGQLTGNQQSGEIAWRLEVTDLTTMVTTHIRDLLIPNCHPTTPFFSPSNWDEDFNDDIKPTATVAWDVRFTEQRVDGKLATEMTVGVPGDTYTNQDLGVDRYGFWDRSVVSRSNPNGTVLHSQTCSVLSTSAYAVGNRPAATFIPLTADSRTAVGQPLIAVITTDLTRTVTPPLGWEILGQHDAAADVRQYWLWRRHNGSTFSWNFDVGAATNNLSGCLASAYGADTLAPPILAPAASSSGQGTAWSAPASTQKTNYGRPLLGLSSSPSNGTVRPLYPAEVVEVGNSQTDNPWWSQTVIAQEAVVAQAAEAGNAKSGDYFDGFTYRNTGRQLILEPPKQRLRIGSFISNSGWQGAPADINEAVPNHTTLISAGDNAVLVGALTSGQIVAPGITDGIAVRYFGKRVDASTSAVFVELLQGASTVIASKTETIPAGTTAVEGVFNLTATQAGNITDWTQLRVRITSDVT